MARGVWKIIHPFGEIGIIKLRLLSYQCTFNNSVNPIGGSAPSLAPTLAQGHLYMRNRLQNAFMLWKDAWGQPLNLRLPETPTVCLRM